MIKWMLLMRVAGGFFLCVALIIGCSPLLAYPVYLLLDGIIDLPFHKAVKYTTLLCALIFSGVYLRLNRLYSAGACGFGAPAGVFVKRLAQGCLVGIAIMLVLSLSLLLLGIHKLNIDPELLQDGPWLVLAKAAVTGLAVGLLEESIFRGAFFSALLHGAGGIAAIFLTSVVYAAVHFLDYEKLPADAEVSWLSGVEILSGAFGGFSAAILDHFLALFALGVLLAMIRLRQGHVAACIGVHAGLVMALKVNGKLSEYTPGSHFDFLVNSDHGLLGYLACCWLLLLIFCYWRSWKT